jgi:hypothetical protein
MPQTAPHLMRRIFFCGAADDLTFTFKTVTCAILEKTEKIQYSFSRRSQ